MSPSRRYINFHHGTYEDYAEWRKVIPELKPAWPGPLLSWKMTDPISLKERSVSFDPCNDGKGLNLWLYRRIVDRNNFRARLREEPRQLPGPRCQVEYAFLRPDAKLADEPPDCRERIHRAPALVRLRHEREAARRRRVDRTHLPTH